MLDGVELTGCPFHVLEIPAWVWSLFAIRDDFKAGWDPVKVGHTPWIPPKTIDALRELDRTISLLDAEAAVRMRDG